MARLNRPSTDSSILTHEGAPARRVTAEQSLRRSVMACLLWEREFYEEGESIAQRIASLIPLVTPATVAAIALEARQSMHLRHVPLFLVREMARHHEHKKLVAATLSQVIQRADELTEFLALYWQEKKQPLAAQVKRGLAAAFTKFSAYDLAKYNRADAIKLRDVLFLTHAKPKDEEQAVIWKQLVEGTLPAPDTWEVALSAGKGTEKAATWERLLTEGKLGGLAFLRNLRNMREAKVAETAIRHGFATANFQRVLPFRFIAAARYAPEWEPELEVAFLRSVASRPRLAGRTLVLVDVSGSMDASLSEKSQMRRLDAACGVAMLARELCREVEVYSFSSALVRIPARRGFALRDAIVGSQPHQSTLLGQAVTVLNAKPHDRLIVITDEQSQDAVPNPVGCGYLLNVASAQNGVGYGPWVHIDGWSDAVLDYLSATENAQ